MPDITIKDFRGGLDARKFVLSQPAGTFTIADNAHINQGAELEKRKAFVRLANSSGGVTTSLPTGTGYTFGWQAVVNGHVVFGSADGAALTFPAAVTYQRLRHPQALNGGADVAMTGLVTSECYAGKVWAAALFSDGRVFSYYDGTLIDDFTAGLILPYLAGNDGVLATNIVQLINKSDRYTAVQRGSTGVLDAFGMPGNLYTTSIVKSSVNGKLEAQLVSNGVATVAGSQAIGQFQITSGTVGTGNYISSVLVNGVTQLLLGGNSILFQSNADTTAAAVATSISSNAVTSGYYAVANGNLISILPLASGISTNGYSVTVVAAGNVCIGSCAFSLGGDSTVGVTGIYPDATIHATSQRAHSGTTATLTIGAHTLVAGNTVVVTGMADARYNGTFVILASPAPTGTQISYTTGTSFSESTTADVGGSVVYQVTALNLCGTIAGTSSGLTVLAASVVTAINAGTAGHHYLANSVGPIIYVSKVTTSSSDAAVNLAVITAGAALTVSAVAGTVQIGLSSYSVQMTSLRTSPSVVTSLPASVSVIIGGTTSPPYTYLWTMVADDPTWPNSIAISNKLAGTVTFSFVGKYVRIGHPNTVIRTTWHCVATGTDNVPVPTSTLDVVLTIS